MALQQFLVNYRSDILELSESTMLSLAALRPTSKKLKEGLPIFLDQLLAVLCKEQQRVSPCDESDIFGSARLHGRELLRLGYTLSHVVHSYGAMCQAITELAGVHEAEVTALEFHNLNRCLDIAIAGAVTEFDEIQNIAIKKREVVHLGSVAHELRNSLNRATISFEMLSKGIVGLGGSTSKVLEFSLHELSILIDRSLSSVRLRADSDLHKELLSVTELISHLTITAEIEAKKRRQTLEVDIQNEAEIFTDRHLILSAIGNLLQNALKYSPKGSRIRIRVKLSGGLAVVEIEDEGGGLSDKLMAQLFLPFVNCDPKDGGLGLGLLIAKEAIDKCEGSIAVRNENTGCIFSVSIPVARPELEIKPVV